MRLLEWKSDGDFSLTKDLIHYIPPYVILSHTWGADTEEVAFVSIPRTETDDGALFSYRQTL